MMRQGIWAPWRLEYVTNLVDTKPGECFLCQAWTRPDEDEQRLVIHRNEHGMIVLNRYPYTNGHVMVALGAHLPDFDRIGADERHAMMDLTVLAERLIRVVLNPQGINIGVNLGRCAGAGLPGHLHLHVVPRWGGDTNFMEVVGGVRVIPQALEQIQHELTAALPKVLDQFT